MTSICVFCGTNPGQSPAHLAAASELGTQLAAQGIGLIYGGGRLGLMGAVADAALAAGGHVTGVIPQALVEYEVAHQQLSALEVTDSMHSRKARMAELADAFIALPGGFGTFEEVLEILTWNQLGFISKPIVLLDIDDFYAPLFALFEGAAAEGFIRPAHIGLAQRAATVPAALAAATTRPPATELKWQQPNGLKLT